MKPLVVLAALAAPLMILGAGMAPWCEAATVEVWSADWCMACQKMKPTVARLIREGLPIRLVDYDRDPATAKLRRIDSLPTVVCYADSGREVRRLTGLISESQLRDLCTGPASLARLPASTAQRKSSTRGSEPKAYTAQPDTYAIPQGPPVPIVETNRLAPVTRTGQTAACARTTNFIVCASNGTVARQVADACEAARKKLALAWFGEELPDWPSPCQVKIKLANNHGGGSTSFAFQNGQATDFTASWQGTPQALVSDVVPHEVMHTLLATRYGRRLPRWIDEAIAQCNEGPVGKTNQWHSLIQSLHARRGIPFNQILSQMEYPRDFRAFYAQSHWMGEFLMLKAGPRSLVKLLDTYFANGDWQRSFQEVYGFKSIGEFQTNWNAWVSAGAPSHKHEVAKPNTVAAFSGGRWHLVNHLLPYRNVVDHRLTRLEQAAARPAQQVPIVLSGGSQTDLAPLAAEVARAHARIDNVVSNAERLAAKYDGQLPGLAADIAAAKGKAESANTAVAEALDEESPTGLIAKIKARLGSGLLAKVLSWCGIGSSGVALILAILALLIRRDVRKRATSGDPTVMEHVAARTPWPWDDVVAQKVADRLAGVYGRVHGVEPAAPVSPADDPTVIDRIVAKVRARLNPQPPATQ